MKNSGLDLIKKELTGGKASACSINFNSPEKLAFIIFARHPDLLILNTFASCGQMTPFKRDW